LYYNLNPSSTDYFLTHHTLTILKTDVEKFTSTNKKTLQLTFNIISLVKWLKFSCLILYCVRLLVLKISYSDYGKITSASVATVAGSLFVINLQINKICSLFQKLWILSQACCSNVI